MRSNTVNETIARLWLNDLYRKLRQAEADAANAELTPLERRAAAEHACYIARQIEAHEEWIRRGQKVLAA